MKAVHLVMAKQPTKQALQVAHQPPPQPPPPVVPRVPTARVRAESWPILQSRTEEEGWHGLGCSLPLDIPRVRATPWDDAYITHGIAEPLAEEDEYDDDARISCAHDDDDDDDGTSVDSRGYTSPLGYTSPQRRWRAPSTLRRRPPRLRPPRPPRLLRRASSHLGDSPQAHAALS